MEYIWWVYVGVKGYDSRRVVVRVGPGLEGLSFPVEDGPFPSRHGRYWPLSPSTRRIHASSFTIYINFNEYYGH